MYHQQKGKMGQVILIILLVLFNAAFVFAQDARVVAPQAADIRLIYDSNSWSSSQTSIQTIPDSTSHFVLDLRVELIEKHAKGVSVYLCSIKSSTASFVADTTDEIVAPNLSTSAQLVRDDIAAGVASLRIMVKDDGRVRIEEKRADGRANRNATFASTAAFFLWPPLPQNEIGITSGQTWNNVTQSDEEQFRLLTGEFVCESVIAWPSGILELSAYQSPGKSYYRKQEDTPDEVIRLDEQMRPYAWLLTNRFGPLSVRQANSASVQYIKGERYVTSQVRLTVLTGYVPVRSGFVR